MLGAPGAGKGTQAAVLADRLGLVHIASGDLFRRHLRDNTTLGKRVKGHIERGALVPDDLTVELIADRLRESDATKGVILDGFPRTRPQAEALDTMLGRIGGAVVAALYVDVDRDVLLRRLSGRWICTAAEQHVYHELTRPPAKPRICDVDGAPLYQREDDAPATVQARLDKQLPPMYEVVDYSAERGVLSAVDGNKPVADVTDALLRAIAQPAA
jgi:adenylate kinase